MKPSEGFKDLIIKRLNEVAERDTLFGETLKKENKNIDDCITYILNSVKKSDCNGFADEEIYGMAAHYYDEDDIDIGNPIQCRVVVNHKAELTQEEIDEAKSIARAKIMEEERQKVAKKPVTPKPNNPIQQGKLF